MEEDDSAPVQAPAQARARRPGPAPPQGVGGVANGGWAQNGAGLLGPLLLRPGVAHVVGRPGPRMDREVGSVRVLRGLLEYSPRGVLEPLEAPLGALVFIEEGGSTFLASASTRVCRERCLYREVALVQWRLIPGASRQAFPMPLSPGCSDALLEIDEVAVAGEVRPEPEAERPPPPAQPSLESVVDFVSSSGSLFTLDTGARVLVPPTTFGPAALLPGLREGAHVRLDGLEPMGKTGPFPTYLALRAFSVTVVRHSTLADRVNLFPSTKKPVGDDVGSWAEECLWDVAFSTQGLEIEGHAVGRPGCMPPGIHRPAADASWETAPLPLMPGDLDRVTQGWLTLRSDYASSFVTSYLESDRLDGAWLCGWARVTAPGLPGLPEAWDVQSIAFTAPQSAGRASALASGCVRLACSLPPPPNCSLNVWFPIALPLFTLVCSFFPASALGSSAASVPGWTTLLPMGPLYAWTGQNGGGWRAIADSRPFPLGATPTRQCYSIRSLLGSAEVPYYVALRGVVINVSMDELAPPVPGVEEKPPSSRCSLRLLDGETGDFTDCYLRKGLVLGRVHMGASVVVTGAERSRSRGRVFFRDARGSALTVLSLQHGAVRSLPPLAVWRAFGTPRPQPPPYGNLAWRTDARVDRILKAELSFPRGSAFTVVVNALLDDGSSRVDGWADQGAGLQLLGIREDSGSYPALVSLTRSLGRIVIRESGWRVDYGGARAVSRTRGWDVTEVGERGTPSMVAADQRASLLAALSNCPMATERLAVLYMLGTQRPGDPPPTSSRSVRVGQNHVEVAHRYAPWTKIISAWRYAA